MIDEAPGCPERDAAEAILLHGDDDAICETLVALALNEDDWAWVQSRCLDFLRHQHWAVRAVAATCLGHLARIHRTLDLSVVLPPLHELCKDPATADYAQNALSDIEIYVGTNDRGTAKEDRG